jgi:hypothetical protein
VTIHEARAVVRRLRRGRTPVENDAGLAPKTVRNAHRMLHRAFTDAVAWDYLVSNSAEGSNSEVGVASLDAFTVDLLRQYLVVLDNERATLGPDVRHTYATLSLHSGVHAKIVSDRIGHAHEGITVQLYGHRSTGHDREAAELVAGLIRTRTRYDGLDSRPGSPLGTDLVTRHEKRPPG